MALQSITRQSTQLQSGTDERFTAPQPAISGSYVSRISPADELQLACRLAECRRELLAIALLDVGARLELSRVSTELASGARRPGDVLEGISDHESARGVLAQLLAQVTQLQDDAASLAARPCDVDAQRGMFDALVERTLDVVKALPLCGDMMDRLLQSSWTSSPAALSPSRAQMPHALRRRARRLETEIETIRSRFIHANQGLVAYVVQRYRGMGLRREDLMQEGNIGLLRAIEKFDHRRGTRFSVYAVWWIRQAVRRALANQSRTIRIPVHALAVRYAVDQASKRLSLELGREPSEQELASATGVVPNGVSQILGMVKEPLSLDAPRGPDTEASLGESVADRAAISPNEHAARKERAARLHCLLDGLSSREREMLRMRFGLDGADECTLEQIGQSFALTRERVRQIVTAALDKLHHQTRVRRLELEPTAD
jgi:RNA polymerase sigma factor (sigma-70 family)